MPLLFSSFNLNEITVLEKCNISRMRLKLMNILKFYCIFVLTYVIHFNFCLALAAGARIVFPQQQKTVRELIFFFFFQICEWMWTEETLCRIMNKMTAHSKTNKCISFLALWCMYVQYMKREVCKRMFYNSTIQPQ